MRTGFSRFYPAGDGLFEYSDADEALAALDAVDGDYRRHSQAARDDRGGIFRQRSRYFRD